MLYKKNPEEFPNCKTDDVEDGAGDSHFFVPMNAFDVSQSLQKNELLEF